MIPVFEGLLPEPHNTIVLKMLFELANWYSLAKLRVHTEETIELLEDATQRVRLAVREFEKVTCAYYHTTELPREEAARGRRNAATTAKAKAKAQKAKESNQTKKASKHKAKSASRKASKAERTPSPSPPTRRVKPKKELNLRTYKWHSLPDYPSFIRRLGPAVGWSTQAVSYHLMWLGCG